MNKQIKYVSLPISVATKYQKKTLASDMKTTNNEVLINSHSKTKPNLRGWTISGKKIRFINEDLGTNVKNATKPILTRQKYVNKIIEFYFNSSIRVIFV